MLKKLIKSLSNQRLIPGIGEFKETLSQALFWGSIVNYVMVAATFYYTTLRMVAPWFRLHWFVLTIFIGAVIIYIVEFKYVVPSIWAFRGKQMDLRNKTKNSDDNLTDKDKIEKAMRLLQEVMSKNDK